MDSSSSEVTVRSVMPQGTIQSKSRRSGVTLRAKPCEVTAWETWMPMAASFFSADGAAGVGPDAGAFTDALGGDAEVFAGEDESFFHEAHEVDGAEVGAAFAGKVAAEVENGIADELAGAVVGDVAAAVDLVDFDAFGCESLVGEEDVGAGRVAAEGEDGRVLEEDQGVADFIRFAGSDDFGLDAQTFKVGDATKLEKVDVHGVAPLEAKFGEAGMVIGTATLRPEEQAFGLCDCEIVDAGVPGCHQAIGVELP